MMKSYINVFRKSSNELVHKFVEDGNRKQEIIRFQPLMGYIIKEHSEWKDIYGNNIKAIRFDSMSEAATWKKENTDIFNIYGDINHISAFIGQTYTDEIKPQKSHMRIFNFDIEVKSSEGFPKSSNPNDYINAITIQNMISDQYYIFSLKDYIPTEKNVAYYKCNSEQHLLEQFIDFINRSDCDILVGYNIIGFDIPYIVERITLLMGEDEAKRLSPIKKIEKNSKILNKREVFCYDICGILVMDYLELIQKFTYQNLESYALNYVAKHFLGKEKISYQEEFGNLDNLYEQDFNKFITYNKKDVELVSDLECKLKLIEIAIGFAYMMKCNLDVIYGTVAPWDSLLYSELYNKGILCSPNKVSKASEYLGGYVKEPDRGMHDWVTVFDIVSSYPNQLISSNLSPETIIPMNQIQKYEDLVSILQEFGGIEKCIDVDKLKKIKPILQKYDLTFTANGQFFKRGKQGFIPAIVQQIFQERMGIKKRIKEAKEKNDKSTVEYLESRSQILKICINSVYGCLGSNYFRYYDTRISSAVTWQGQLCARGVATYMSNNINHISWKYSDTDSVFFSLNEIVKKRFPEQLPDKETIVKFLLKYQDNIVTPVINEFFRKLGENMNMREMTIRMEHECLADVSIFVEKKKYVMQQLYKEGDWYIEKPKLKIKGIEIVRSSTPQVVRDKLKKALQLIFETGDNDVLISFIEDFRKEFYTLPYESVAFPRGVKIGEYALGQKSVPIQVRAALIYNKALKDLQIDQKYVSIGDGTKIKFCYIKVPNKFGSDAIACLDKMPEEVKKHFEIDYKTQFEKAMISPIEKILGSIGWKVEKGMSLEDWF